ncbi:hypothetical protein AB0L64_37895 [Kribbella sp. NPDC051936]|uniref:hypothetical protein n=1 Tax=Kribbella sp. NPDC051936 TaxID=3154946 RepID=UPI0034196F70
MTEAEISPASWEYRLVAAVVFAVDQRVGGTAAAPRTRWTGLLLEETDPNFLGTAGDDGSMSVSVVNVLEPLRKARDLDRPLTAGEALELRDAIGTLAHEAAHLLTELGDETAPEAYPYDSAAEADNEGRTEYWTHANLDNIIRDVFPDAGLEHVQAAVLSQTSIDAYPAYTSAVRDLDQALAERSELTHEQVTHTLMLADDAQRWNVAADLVIDARLAKPGLMLEADRADVRRQLVAPLRAAFSGLEAVESDESLGDEQKTAAATEAAQKAIAGLDAAVNRVERKYRIDNAQRARLLAVTSGQAPAAGATGRRTGVDRGQAGPRDGSRGRQAPGRPSGPRAPGVG